MYSYTHQRVYNVCNALTRLQKMKEVKKQRSVEKRHKVIESRKSLTNVRVVQKNLVFVIGLSPRLADPEVNTLLNAY